MTMYETAAQASIVEVSDALSSEISKSQFYKFIHENDYEKVGPGMYVSPDTFEDELLVLSKRCPNGVISHDEALYHYGLIDREPSYHTITVYSGYNASRLTQAGYKVYYVKKELLELGKTEVISNCGNAIPMYDLERTMVDLIRNRSQFEIQDFNAALKSYAARKDKDLNKLSLYAEKFRVGNVLRTYMGVLL